MRKGDWSGRRDEAAKRGWEDDEGAVSSSSTQSGAVAQLVVVRSRLRTSTSRNSDSDSSAPTELAVPLAQEGNQLLGGKARIPKQCGIVLQLLDKSVEVPGSASSFILVHRSLWDFSSDFSGPCSRLPGSLFDPAASYLYLVQGSSPPVTASLKPFQRCHPPRATPPTAMSSRC